MKIITLKDLQPQDKPGDGWYIIEPHGDHPNETSDGKTILQVLDRTAMEAIVTAGIITEGGLLIDRDHLSLEEDHGTEAMGWVKELALIEDAEGNTDLAGWIEWSSAGLALIQGKVYKKFSTVYLPGDMEALGGNRYRPLRLSMLAITNMENNLGQRPITNSRRRPICNSNNPNNDMTAIAELLGLPAEATEEDILTAIKALQDAQSQAQDAEADAIINSSGVTDMTPEEKEMMKEELVTNRGRALKVLEARAAAADKANKDTAPKTPRYAGGVIANRKGVIGGRDKAAAMKALTDRAHELQKSTGCSYWTGVNIARSQGYGE